MGLSNFLVHVLRSSGRAVDLMDYTNSTSTAGASTAGRSGNSSNNTGSSDKNQISGNDDTHGRMRIAIDVSSWIHGACQGHSDVLASDKHLSNYGRAALLLETQQQHETRGDSAVESGSSAAGAAAATAAGVATLDETQLLEFVAKVCTTVVDRLEKIQTATNAKLLVVFDGASPPIKSLTVQERGQKRKLEIEQRDLPVDASANSPALERRMQANRRAGAGQHYDTVVQAILVALRSRDISFMVAPYEADAQLAFLQRHGHVDLIVVDDSDLIAYGLATPALYKLSVNPDNVYTRGMLLRRNDLAAIRLASSSGSGAGGNASGSGTATKKGSTSAAAAVVVLDFLDFSPVMLACLFASLGCDYCSKLAGIGTAVACRLVNEAFFPTSRRRHDMSSSSPLERLLTKLLQAAWKRHTFTDEEKETFKSDFCAAVFMFRHAIVYDPLNAHCRPLLLDENADAELVSYEPYAALLRDPIRRAKIVGRMRPPTIATHVAEGWLCAKTLKIRQGFEVPERVRRDVQEYLSSSDDNGAQEDQQQDPNEDDDNGGLESQPQMMDVPNNDNEDSTLGRASLSQQEEADKASGSAVSSRIPTF